ncbi:hypothetical protein [Burkholderia sp. WAC0059]|uniref:hypothetical protein n=1 Tax=Burkholderia sp. WAC0059 TaxID=2066022 RepID=UPI0011AFA39E|nr:hypothetical protein [Burkholderia sp. WAC0059]
MGTVVVYANARMGGAASVATGIERNSSARNARSDRGMKKEIGVLGMGRECNIGKNMTGNGRSKFNARRLASSAM